MGQLSWKTLHRFGLFLQRGPVNRKYANNYAWDGIHKELFLLDEWHDAATYSDLNSDNDLTDLYFILFFSTLFLKRFGASSPHSKSCIIRAGTVQHVLSSPGASVESTQHALCIIRAGTTCTVKSRSQCRIYPARSMHNPQAGTTCTVKSRSQCRIYPARSMHDPQAGTTCTVKSRSQCRIYPARSMHNPQAGTTCCTVKSRSQCRIYPARSMHDPQAGTTCCTVKSRSQCRIDPARLARSQLRSYVKSLDRDVISL